jgi:O-antigen/teichoic acid export membrane protein
MRTRALGAITAQAVQAGASFVLQILVARWLGVEELGRFAILYGLIIIASAVVTGFVGDTLIVLDRRDARIRSALQGSTVMLSVAIAVVAAIVVGITGLVSGLEAAIFAVALLVFVVEEVLRRLLMASLAFLRVAGADLAGFAVALAILVGIEFTSGATLVTFLVAIAIGQLCGIGVAILLLPRDERYAVRFQRGGYREVAGYGTWRGFQQLLRPTLFTVVRIAVGVAAGLTAVGLLEAARVYVAPALLIIGGLTSYLFVGYARDGASPLRSRLRRADRAVAGLLAVTVVLGAIALLLLGWAGPALFGTELDALAVAGWLLYAASVAAVTPYGSLAAVIGRQSTVFAIRAGDTALSAVAVVVALGLGAEPRLMPMLLAAGSVLGGIAIRALVLAPLQRAPKGSTAPDGAGDGDAPLAPS